MKTIKKVLLSIITVLLLVSVLTIPTFAAKQSITGLPLGIGFICDYEWSVSEKSSLIISASYITVADLHSTACGLGFGRKWYFNEAQDGGYLGLGLGLSSGTILYSGKILDIAKDNSVMAIDSIVGFKKITASGFAYDLGIGVSLTTSTAYPNASFCPCLQLGMGYGW